MSPVLSFNVSGNVVIDTDAGTLDMHLSTAPGVPPPVPPPVSHEGEDEIDLQSVIITSGSPDVRGWAKTSQLTEVSINRNANMNVDFTRRWGMGAWPLVLNMEGGEIQYTLWLLTRCGNPDGPWFAGAGIDCISRAQDDNYVPTGHVLDPNKIPNDWFYFLSPPLGGYQPAIGEPVGWMLTAGAQRRDDVHVLEERTNIIITPFAAGTYLRG